MKASTLLVMLGLISGCAVGGQGAVSTVDAISPRWDAMMLNGEFGVREGKRSVTFEAQAPFSAANGWVNQVLRTKGAVIITRENCPKIQGGLVRRADVGGRAVVELYAKQLPWELNDKDFNRLVTWGGPAYEFFLLFRPEPRAKAAIYRKWSVPFDGPGRMFLRGFLEYDMIRGVAVVRITDGLDQVVVQEGVPVPRAIGDPAVSPCQAILLQSDADASCRRSLLHLGGPFPGD